MKKLIFVFVSIFIIGQVMSQDLTKVKTIENSVQEKDITDNQIKQAIEKDKELQKNVIETLKNDDDSKDVISKLESSNMVSDKNVMKNILGDKNLTQMAIDCVRNNPALLSKAKTVLGI